MAKSVQNVILFYVLLLGNHIEVCFLKKCFFFFENPKDINVISL